MSGNNLEELSITDSDFKEIQNIVWNSPVKVADTVEELTLAGRQCARYLPCPICRRCSNRAVHLYLKCRTCPVPKCIHTYQQKTMMIKRENFAVYLPETVMDRLDTLAADAHNRRDRYAGAEHNSTTLY